ncbi:phospholipid scramblase 3 isoform X2 [Bombina bombina]|uniref:phospholipid scramblase 3 isoform X2 n=1 Tax=Bombina bombina TaxID=8345 RepID=UPI00235AC3EF|nr:phospholipid scramblase 3 isoform X2 [Bombina bombina]
MGLSTVSGFQQEQRLQRLDTGPAHLDAFIMAGIPAVPPGLENLLQINEVHVKQTRQSAFQTRCTYDVFTSDGCLIYRAEQEIECCGPRFNLQVQNLQGYNVMNLLLPNSCWGIQLQVFGPPGMLLGYIDKEWASFNSSFNILTALGQPSIKVKGPGWGGAFMSDVHFQVMTLDGSAPLGVITRVWRGVRKEFFSVNDNYKVQFPGDLDVKVKALLIACTFFIILKKHKRRKIRQYKRKKKEKKKQPPQQISPPIPAYIRYNQ